MGFHNSRSAKVFLASVLLSLSTSVHAAITGTVFLDHNSDGVRNLATTITTPALDPGVGGVTVTAYAISGSSVATTTSCGSTIGGDCTGTNAGFYSLAVSGSGPYRIEFTGLPAATSDGARGAGSGTGVQFVASPNASGVDLGVHRGAAFCQANPTLITVCFVVGDQLTGPYFDQPVVFDLKYLAGNASTSLVGGPGGHDDSGFGVGMHQVMIPANQVGSVFGVAYRRRPAATFLAAYLRAFVSFGPGDSTGAIYQVTGASTASLFVDLNALFPGVPPIAGANPHPIATADFTNDSDEGLSGPLVGKVALGDIEVSEDDTTLWVINLADRRLYHIPIDSPSAAERFDIPSGACSDPDDAHPFALGEREGLIYVGLVCSAESSASVADLRAAVYSFDPQAETFSGSPVLAFDLDFGRGCANGSVDWPVSGSCGLTSRAAWQPWRNDPSATPSVPQPMLTDIVFDGADMLLGFRDRYGDQSQGFIRVAGDILRACFAGGAWTLESNGSCGGITTAGADTGQGPGPGPASGPGQPPVYGFGEYYTGDPYSAFHSELSMGGLVQVPGFPDVTVSMLDPIFQGVDTTFDGGFRWLRNTLTTGMIFPGQAVRSYRLYDDDGNFEPGGGPFFGKVNGLGGVEALCDPSPVQIGNRIWMDNDGDGVQDAGEMPLADITLFLYDGSGNLIGTSSTDAKGEWYFNFSTAASDPDTGDNTVLAPDPYEQSVYVVIDPAEVTGPELTGKAVTLANADGSANGDARDSDATNITVPGGVGARIGVVVDVGLPGENTHGFDMGFAPLFDLGDLPEGVAGFPNYQTTRASDGARHAVDSEIFLGGSVDDELEGQPNSTATGDGGDEDGVVAADLNLQVSTTSGIRAIATNLTGSAATLCGFVDFNEDGDFDDPGEAAQASVLNGSNNQQFTLTFNVPAIAAAATFARFRLSTDADCSPFGAASNGEVEDYRVAIAGGIGGVVVIPTMTPLGLAVLSLALLAAAFHVFRMRRHRS